MFYSFVMLKKSLSFLYLNFVLSFSRLRRTLEIPGKDLLALVVHHVLFSIPPQACNMAGGGSALNTTVKAKKAPIPSCAVLILATKEKALCKGFSEPRYRAQCRAQSPYTTLSSISQSTYSLALRDPTLAPAPSLVIFPSVFFISRVHKLPFVPCAFTCWEISPAQGLKMLSPR